MLTVACVPRMMMVMAVVKVGTHHRGCTFATTKSLCWVWTKNNNTTLVFLLSNCPQVLTIFYDWPVNYYFVRFRYMITISYTIGFSCLSTFHKGTNCVMFVCVQKSTFKLQKMWIGSRLCSTSLFEYCRLTH